MTVTADRTALAAPRPEPDVPLQPSRRVDRRSPGVITPADLVRLAMTLSLVVGAVAGLGLRSTGSYDDVWGRVLHTPYGVVALGHVTTASAAPDGGGGRSVGAGGPRPGAALRVTVPVTLHNLSGGPVHYGPQHFRLSGSGSTARPEPGSVPSGEVAPGGAVQLHLVFDLPGGPWARLTVDDGRPAAGLRLHLPRAGDVRLPEVRFSAGRAATGVRARAR